MNAHSAYITNKFKGETETEDNQGRAIWLRWSHVDGETEILAILNEEGQTVDYWEGYTMAERWKLEKLAASEASAA